MRTIGATLLVLISIFLPAAQAAPTVSIHDIQYSTAPSGTSPYRGLEVTTTGVVTASTPDGFYIADGAGAWNAIFVYTSQASPQVGDLIRVTAWVYEYYGMTELINPSAGELISSGHEVVATPVSAGAVAQEQYESVLVRVEDVQVAALASFGEWVVADTSGYVFCDDQNDYAYFPAVGDVLQSVTGVVAFTYGAFKIEPRWTADIAGDSFIVTTCPLST